MITSPPPNKRLLTGTCASAQVPYSPTEEAEQKFKVWLTNDRSYQLVIFASCLTRDRCRSVRSLTLVHLMQVASLTKQAKTSSSSPKVRINQSEVMSIMFTWGCQPIPQRSANTHC